jgi:hypothetical protein
MTGHEMASAASARAAIVITTAVKPSTGIDHRTRHARHGRRRRRRTRPPSSRQRARPSAAAAAVAAGVAAGAATGRNPIAPATPSRRVRATETLRKASPPRLRRRHRPLQRRRPNPSLLGKPCRPCRRLRRPGPARLTRSGRRRPAKASTSARRNE